MDDCSDHSSSGISTLAQFDLLVFHHHWADLDILFLFLVPMILLFSPFIIISIWGDLAFPLNISCE